MTNGEAEKYFSTSKSKYFGHYHWDGMLRDVTFEACGICKRTVITRNAPHETHQLSSGSTVDVDRYLIWQYVTVTILIISGHIIHVFFLFCCDASGIIIHKINQFLVAFDIMAADLMFA